MFFFKCHILLIFLVLGEYDPYVNFEQAGLILAGSCYGLLLLGLAVEYLLQKDIFPPGFFENECFFIQLHSTPFARYSWACVGIRWYLLVCWKAIGECAVASRSLAGAVSTQQQTAGLLQQRCPPTHPFKICLQTWQDWKGLIGGWMAILTWKRIDGSDKWKSNLSRNPETEPHSAGERGWKHVDCVIFRGIAN